MLLLTLTLTPVHLESKECHLCHTAIALIALIALWETGTAGEQIALCVKIYDICEHGHKVCDAKR